MTITFLGTGTSQGVPVIACECPICTSTDKRDKRLRTSILVEDDSTSVVIDSGPDFRYQMLREGVRHLDAILFTHEHKDHIAGLDDVRAFNFKQQMDMPVYAVPRVQEAIKREFAYIFSGVAYPGIPKVVLNSIDLAPFQIGTILFTPIEVMHHLLPVLGFRIKDFTYITDAKTITATEKAKIKGSKILVLNALRREKHMSHFTLAEAVAMAEELGAETTYFTHLSHQLGTQAELEAELPSHIRIAYDGMKLTI